MNQIKDDLKEIKELLKNISSSLEILTKNLNSQTPKKEITTPAKLKEKTTSTLTINDFSELQQFLNSKNIKIKQIPEETPADKILDKIAFFMGNKYSSIKTIYNLLKKDLYRGNGFKLSLKNYSQDVISATTQLCTLLYQIAFLEEYKYYKSPHYMLYAKTNKIPEAINFLTGGWLERYTKTTIIKIIEELSTPTNPIKYSYLKNPKIILPNGDYFELDLLFKIENEVFWFETKTGDYQRYINKYSKITDLMNLDYDHSYLILTDINDEIIDNLKNLFKMNVVRIDNFYEVFKKYIEKMVEKR